VGLRVVEQGGARRGRRVEVEERRAGSLPATKIRQLKEYCTIVPMAKTSLPPGFRFHPTDVELTVYYLKRKLLGKHLRCNAITEIDLYKFAPWDLPGIVPRRTVPHISAQQKDQYHHLHCIAVLFASLAVSVPCIFTFGCRYLTFR
jgi:hypothetical protein